MTVKVRQRNRTFEQSELAKKAEIYLRQRINDAGFAKIAHAEEAAGLEDGYFRTHLGKVVFWEVVKLRALGRVCNFTPLEYYVYLGIVTREDVSEFVDRRLALA